MGWRSDEARVRVGGGGGVEGGGGVLGALWMCTKFVSAFFLSLVPRLSRADSDAVGLNVLGK